MFFLKLFIVNYWRSLRKTETSCDLFTCLAFRNRIIIWEHLLPISIAVEYALANYHISNEQYSGCNHSESWSSNNHPNPNLKVCKIRLPYPMNETHFVFECTSSRKQNVLRCGRQSFCSQNAVNT